MIALSQIKIKPDWLIIAAVFLVFLGIVPLATFGIVHLRPYQIPLIGAIWIGILQVLNKRSEDLTIRRMTVYLSAYVVCVAVSVINAEYVNLAVKQIVLQSIYITMFLLIATTIRTENALSRLNRAIIMSCFLACGYGVGMFLLLNMQGNHHAGGYYFERPRSFFAEPNEFGLYLVFAYGFLFSTVYARCAMRVLNKTVLMATLGLVLVLLAINMSRGSWMGVMAATFVVVSQHQKAGIRRFGLKKLLRAVLVIMATIASVSVASLFIPARYNTTMANVIWSRSTSVFSGNDATSKIRLSSDWEAMKTIVKNPLVGVGFGNICTVFKGGMRDGAPILATSSNMFLDIGAEIGIMGLGMFLLFLWEVLRAGRRLLASSSGYGVRVIIIGAMASFVGIVFNGMTYSSYLLPFLWISAGILAVKQFNSEHDGGYNAQ